VIRYTWSKKARRKVSHGSRAVYPELVRRNLGTELPRVDEKGNSSLGNKVRPSSGERPKRVYQFYIVGFPGDFEYPAGLGKFTEAHRKGNGSFLLGLKGAPNELLSRLEKTAAIEGAFRRRTRLLSP